MCISAIRCIIAHTTSQTDCDSSRVLGPPCSLQLHEGKRLCISKAGPRQAGLELGTLRSSFCFPGCGWNLVHLVDDATLAPNLKIERSRRRSWRAGDRLGSQAGPAHHTEIVISDPILTRRPTPMNHGAGPCTKAQACKGLVRKIHDLPGSRRRGRWGAKSRFR